MGWSVGLRSAQVEGWGVEGTQEGILYHQLQQVRIKPRLAGQLVALTLLGVVALDAELFAIELYTAKMTRKATTFFTMVLSKAVCLDRVAYGVTWLDVVLNSDLLDRRHGVSCADGVCVCVLCTLCGVWRQVVW